jgi:hypothetical protein
LSRFVPLLAISLCLGLAAPASASALPREFFGIQGWTPPSARTFNTLGRAGLGTYRYQLNWGAVEARRGQRRWGGVDAVFRNAAANGMTVLPYILGSPGWAASRAQYPPTGDARGAWLNFVREAGARYGQGGSFWSANPRLPARPPTYWQIWNEPNFSGYWFGRPNAAQYVDFLSESGSALRGGDPGARIALAGLPETHIGIPGSKFLKQIYARPGARDAFDAVVLHPYARDARGVLGAVIRARRTMRRNGDAGKPILVTEVGWATGGPVGPRTRAFRTSLRGQARRLASTFRTLTRNQRRYGVEMVVVFSLRDRRRLAGERDWWAIHTGVFTRRGRAKPAWGTLRRWATKY